MFNKIERKQSVYQIDHVAKV